MRDPDMDAIYRAYAGTVYRFLFCLSRDRPLSEELTQETFYQAMRSVERFRGDCKLSVWLCQIAKRLWYRELKRRKRLKTLPLTEDLPLLSPQDVEGDFLRREESDELHRRLRQLNSDIRGVMLLRLTGEMSFEEIGELMGHSAGWARVTFYRGKEKIAREWKDDEKRG